MGGGGGAKAGGKIAIKNCIRKVERANTGGKGAAIAHEVSGRVFARSLPPSSQPGSAANVASNLRFCAHRALDGSVRLSTVNLDFASASFFPIAPRERAANPRAEVSFAE